MKPKRERPDHVGPVLSMHVPSSVRNQVNGITSFSRKLNEPQWRRHVEDRACFRRNGLRFTIHNPDEERFFDDLFHGIDYDAHKELWFVMCYAEMRSRNLWPVNIAAEQRSSDELTGPTSGMPNTPAAIQ